MIGVIIAIAISNLSHVCRSLSREFQVASVCGVRDMKRGLSPIDPLLPVVTPRIVRSRGADYYVTPQKLPVLDRKPASIDGDDLWGSNVEVVNAKGDELRAEVASCGAQPAAAACGTSDMGFQSSSMGITRRSASSSSMRRSASSVTDELGLFCLPTLELGVCCCTACRDLGGGRLQ